MKQYNLTLTILGAEYKSKGKTIEECFENIPLLWKEIKAKGIVKLTNGEKSCEKLFALPILRRIMVNPVARMLWARRLESLLN